MINHLYKTHELQNEIRNLNDYIDKANLQLALLSQSNKDDSSRGFSNVASEYSNGIKKSHQRIAECKKLIAENEEKDLRHDNWMRDFGKGELHIAKIKADLKDHNNQWLHRFRLGEESLEWVIENIVRKILREEMAKNQQMG